MEMSKQDLARKYAESPVSELLEIIENKQHYTNEAIVAAIEELSLRKITTDEIAKLKAEQAATLKEKGVKQYVSRLNIWQKHLFFFLWIPLLTFPFRQNFRDSGHYMKLKQANYFSLLGFLSMMLSTYITIQYNLSNISFWLILIPAFGITLIFDGVFNPVYTTKDQNDS